MSKRSAVNICICTILIFVSFMLFLVGCTTIPKIFSNNFRVIQNLDEFLISSAETVLPTVVSLSPYVPLSPSVRSKDTPHRGYSGNNGAGVIINSDKGFIVTNNHIVRNAKKIQVTLHNKEKVVGHILGVDKYTDLALIKIDTDKKLQSAKFGDSNQVKIGQLVQAVGNPYGLNNTLTLGIVSGLNRTNLNLSEYEDYIQTDAAINPGNSGGPMFNIHGEIIGINTAIINYGQSVGFAIPSNTVKRVVSELIEFGEVRRGWLGVEFGIEEKERAFVGAVIDNSPASHAGIEAGDIILKIESTPVGSPDEVTRLIGTLLPGQTIHIDILRDGEHKVIPVTLGNLKDYERRKIS